MSNQSNLIAYIKATTGQANLLTIPRLYIDLMGSIDGGLFLSQLIYWSDRGGDSWFFKTYAEWQDELTLSKYEVGKQVKKLKERGILQTKLRKVGGAPTVHYLFSFDEFQKWIVKFLDNGKSRNLTMESEETSQSSYTSTTTETKTTKKHKNARKTRATPPPPPDAKLDTNDKAAAKRAVKRLLSAYGRVLGYTIPNYGKEGTAAKKLLKQGYSEEQVLACYEHMKRQQFWRDKHISLHSVMNQVGAFLQNGDQEQQEEGWDESSRLINRLLAEAEAKEAA